MSLIIACPLCHQPNEIPEPDVGRFATCEHCKEPYYVVVPPLDEDRSPGMMDRATAFSRAVPKVHPGPRDRSSPEIASAIFDRLERLQQFTLYLQCITLALVGYLFLRSLW
jgi:hypothetical protein